MAAMPSLRNESIVMLLAQMKAPKVGALQGARRAHFVASLPAGASTPPRVMDAEVLVACATCQQYDCGNLSSIIFLQLLGLACDVVWWQYANEV